MLLIFSSFWVHRVRARNTSVRIQSPNSTRQNTLCTVCSASYTSTISHSIVLQSLVGLSSFLCTFLFPFANTTIPISPVLLVFRVGVVRKREVCKVTFCFPILTFLLIAAEHLVLWDARFLAQLWIWYPMFGASFKFAVLVYAAHALTH
jgi:hypothetical protein